ncbi:unnamed protein product [Cladocopium goreaui]|uniref:Uncharacterized protein n=1 Tax=Cladocopium goreaui TaxID=2562237 RepID=A0A9P1C8X8_9DINO|nr:unnamed protein product [Cladocopium goreaui]
MQRQDFFDHDAFRPEQEKVLRSALNRQELSWWWSRPFRSCRTKSRNSMPGQRNFIAHMAMMKMHHSKHVCWDLHRKMRRSLTRQCEGNAAAQHKKWRLQVGGCWWLQMQ